MVLDLCGQMIREVNPDESFGIKSSLKYNQNLGYILMVSTLNKYYTFFNNIPFPHNMWKNLFIEGDKFFYLRGDRVINDYDGLVECGDDSDVRNMIVSYKMHKKKLIKNFTLSKNYNIVMNTSLGEHDPRDNTSEEVNEVIMEEHELANSTVRSRSCCPLKVNGWKEIEQDKIDHMWDIILEKFNFDVSEGKRDAIFGHMSDLYRDYRHKLKRKYFDSKSTYQLRLRNKPKHFGADEWKYIWSTFGVMLTFRREVCKTRQIDRNVPYLHILEPKVMQDLDMKWRKMEKLLLVLTFLWNLARGKRKNKLMLFNKMSLINLINLKNNKKKEKFL
ncbi:hypothetical protein KY289_035746 [Solanum tuberosum]|nr:hypothetical protein KY289_035746 [Solanum tuberosum]